MSVITVLCVNVVTANMLLSVFFVSGASAACPEESDLFIAAPKEMEALNGSCLQIPCTFRAKSGHNFDSKREIFGVWIKSDPSFGTYPNNVIFNSSRTDNSYPMSLTGNLRHNNCTTLFSSLLTSYSDLYFFRIENEPFKGTAVCDPLQITVRDSPPSPRIEISAHVKEEESVTITCSAVTPCPHSPPKLTWSLQQDSPNTIEENTNGTFTTRIQEKITLSHQHDGYNLTCSATYPVNEGKAVKTAEETKTLSVKYAPKNTSVSTSPSGSVSAGSWMNLSCPSRAKPPVSRFIWFKISTDGPKTVSEGQFYSFNVTDGGVYYCLATNDVGNQTSPRIHVTIQGTENFLQWAPALGGTIVIILICIAVCVWRKHQTPQQTQSQSSDELVLQMPASQREDDIHYGEIDFSKRSPEPSSDSVQDSGQQQDTLYAQVKASEPAHGLTETADDQEDLYAQVKKK